MSYDLSAAKAYGQALFAAAKEQGVVDVVWADAQVIGQAREQVPGFRVMMRAPHILRERKEEVVRRVFAGVQPLLRDFVLLALRRDRVEVLEDALWHFHELAEHDQGYSHGRLVSAVPLDDAQKASLHAALEAHTNLKLTIDHDVDPALVGGIVFQCGDLLIDNSLRSSLDELGDRLMAVRVH
jgi:F-type H+-transporting ATPase subunit delta